MKRGTRGNNWRFQKENRSTPVAGPVSTFFQRNDLMLSTTQAAFRRVSALCSVAGPVGRGGARTHTRARPARPPRVSLARGLGGCGAAAAAASESASAASNRRPAAAPADRFPRGCVAAHFDRAGRTDALLERPSTYVALSLTPPSLSASRSAPHQNRWPARRRALWVRPHSHPTNPEQTYPTNPDR